MNTAFHLDRNAPAARTASGVSADPADSAALTPAKVLRIGITAALLLVLLIYPASIQAQQDPALRGMVLNSENNLPVLEAYLFLHPKNNPQGGTGLSVEDDGGFLFSGLFKGDYVLSVNCAGYKVQVMEVEITGREETDMIVYLHPRTYETEPVIVTGSHTHTRIEPSDELSSVLNGRDLDRELGLTLAATLKNETGIAMRAMGPAPARPVIRGLGGDRVVLSEDGSKTTDLSATSPDHAVTIEPFAVERIEVLRGPLVLTQTPTTLGGIVNVVRHEIPQDRHESILGSIGLYAESANSGGLGSFYSEVPLDPLMLRAEVSARGAGDIRTPEGRLKNSYARSLDYSGGASFIHDAGFVGASFRDFALDYGVPGGFVGAHPKGVDIELERRQINFRGKQIFDTPLLHDLTFHLNRAYYRHKEFEANGVIGSEFRIVNYAGDIRATHHSFGVVTEGMFGIDFNYRDFTVGGFVFTMPSTSLDIAPYVFERARFGNLSLEAAMRYTWNHITPQREKADANIGAIRERTFGALSASATVLYEITDVVHIGANISRSNRMPTIEELFSEGPHLAAYSYEVGNPDLDLEQGVGAELFLYHQWERFSFNLNVFRNELSAFIIPRNTGQINYATFLPIYASEGVGALLTGAELQSEWNVAGTFHLYASISYTRGTFKDGGKPLPQIPPLKVNLGSALTLGSWKVGLETVMAARQERVDIYELPTAGYATVNLSVQNSIISGRQVHNISLVAENILDQPYRNHLSRVKAILPEAGVNVRLTYKLHFDI
ncbi:MAG: TonB-dependent receptor [Bacteroidota bacterium]